jgi:hypothetical protein
MVINFLRGLEIILSDEDFHSIAESTNGWSGSEIEVSLTLTLTLTNP